MEQNLQEEQLKRTKEISRTIRQAIRDSLPGPPDQFLTLMIPGKVLNFDQFCKDFDASGRRKTALPSREVQLAEAILCDDMPTLGPLQLGPTGRSVSRSYAATLSKFCPAGSTIGISEEVATDKLSNSEKRYQNAMSWLTWRDPNNKNKTRVDLYRQKQAEYTNAFEHKTKAFRLALDSVSKDKTVDEQRQEYDEWVSENYKTYNNLIQAAYMDWVTMGKKEEVEYYFSIVDNDSAMARVEASKESMRLSVVTDETGSSEYQRVRLDPDNWALFARNKADAGPQGETVESLTFQISRLEKINFLLESMRKHSELIPVGHATNLVDAAATDQDAEAVGERFLKARKAYDELVAKRKEGADAEGGEPGDAEHNSVSTELNEARKALREHFEKVDKKNVRELSSNDREALQELVGDGGTRLGSQIEVNNEKIRGLKEQRADIQRTNGKTDAAATVQDDFADKAGIPRAPPSALDVKKEGSWTSITVEVSSSSSRDSQESSATSVTVDASYGWGWNRVSASVSHQQSQAAASKEMANASMKISFECMRVDITRPWLRAELFYDHDLRVAEGDFVSPGNRLPSLIDRAHPEYSKVDDDKRSEDMGRYDLFPMYPTSFLIAANVVLEIHGESSSIQSHLSSSSTSGSVGINYGPFALGGSAAHSNSNSETTCSATAAGCRITIKSPQIVGWISQIVPELPRPHNPFTPDYD